MSGFGSGSYGCSEVGGGLWVLAVPSGGLSRQGRRALHSHALPRDSDVRRVDQL